MLDLKSWQEQWSTETWREALQETDAAEIVRCARPRSVVFRLATLISFGCLKSTPGTPYN